MLDDDVRAAGVATPPSRMYVDSIDLLTRVACFVAFGKGSGHPASLNFGDLFSYALAKVRGLPLL